VVLDFVGGGGECWEGHLPSMLRRHVLFPGPTACPIHCGG